MRRKLKLLYLALIAVFIFSFAECSTSASTETAAAATTAFAEKTAEAETTEPSTAIPETTHSSVAGNVDYNITDTGPAGGFIFFVNPNYATDGWKYLEAAPGDFPGNKNDYNIQWYNGSNVDTGATATAIGTGMPNTQKIINIQGEGSYAAKICFDLTQGGYSDWFLPSKDELNLMYENLYLKSFGSFKPDGYWSSSEGVAGLAWVQYFDNGLQDSFSKVFGLLRVRAMRAF